MAIQVTGQAQGLVLNNSQKAGAPAALSVGWNNELLASELLPRYAALTLAGVVYCISSAAGAVTAFTGGAGGTPSVAVWNPTTSGKNLILLSATACVTTMLGSAGTSPAELWLGQTATITGTASVPQNMLTGVTSGSQAKGYVNTAMTSSTAISFVAGLGSIWWATAAAGASTTINWEAAGQIIVAPGNLLALGFRTNAGSLVADASLIWAELPA